MCDFQCQNPSKTPISKKNCKIFIFCLQNKQISATIYYNAVFYGKEQTRKDPFPYEELFANERK